MSLHTLLQKISDNKHVNFERLITLLPPQYKWSDLFTITQANKKQYHVSIKDQAAFNTLIELATPAQSRASAAAHLLQSSHAVTCDSAYMLCFPAQPSSSTMSVTTDQLPQRQLHCAATLNHTLLTFPYTPAKYAVLIENQDCFFQWHAFLEHFDCPVPIDECDIYFAGGKRILNDKLAPILAPYQALYCLFDYDYEGLHIASILQARYPKDVFFLTPAALSKLAHLFTFSPNSVTDWQQTLVLSQSLNLGELYELFVTTRQFMEQEALLSVLPAKR